MTNRQEMIFKGYQQRITELVSEYENKLIQFRVDATIELNTLKDEIKGLKGNIEALESEVQMYRSQEMEVQK